MGKVLVIAAHSDDEVLGCGGTMARHAAKGDDVRVIFLTNGVGARASACSEEEVSRRDEAMEKALVVLGAKCLSRLDFPDNRLDSVPLLDVIVAMDEQITNWGTPETIYLHHPSDLNVDHRIASQASLTLFRPQDGASQTLLSYEVCSSTGWNGSSNTFQPNYYVDISGSIEKKKEALEAYSLEMRAWPHARSLESVESLAKYRGATVGVEAAEAFVVERIKC